MARERRLSKARVHAALVLFLLLLFPVNCQIAKRQRERLNVVFILIDALRADHLGCYGYSRPTSPVIDAFARRSAVFDAAYSNASWTKPSIPTLFTGLYPRQHQVFFGDKHDTAGHITSDVLSAEFDTLAERMKADGYDTAAFVNNAQIRSFLGFNQGFNIYKEDLGDAMRVTETFLTWLRTGPHRPFFAYIHYLDTHWPYRPPGPFAAVFPLLPGATVDFNGADWRSMEDRIRSGNLKLSAADSQNLTNLYDGSIRFTDAAIGQLLATLSVLGLDDHTVVVITADHGEEFLEHGGVGHGHTLYDEVLHVPLIIHASDARPQRIPRQVQLVDVMPTILDLADRPVQLAGRSLAPLMRNTSSEDEIAFAEHRSTHWLESIRSGHYKLIRSFVFPGYKQHSVSIPKIDTGMWLKVKGVQHAANEFVATKVEKIEPLDSIHLRGALSETDLKAQKFKVLGIPCRIDQKTAVKTEDGKSLDLKALANGVWFRLKGTYVANQEFRVKEATKVQDSANYQNEIKAPIVVLNSGEKATSARMLAIPVTFDTSSKFAGVWPNFVSKTTKEDSPWRTPMSNLYKIRQLHAVELFDLTADPHEKNNIAKGNPTVVRDLTQRLDVWEKQFAPKNKSVQEKALDDETVQRLRALGYVQ